MVDEGKKATIVHVVDDADDADDAVNMDEKATGNGINGALEYSISFQKDYKMPTRTPKTLTMIQTLVLSYQSLGVVYGDLGTSPLYVFSSITLSNPDERSLLGILSLIFWTLTMIALVKYVNVVLQADDHGEGGTFALYSLLRQYINFKEKMIMPNSRLDSDYSLQFHSNGSRRRFQSKTQKFIETSTKAQHIITFIVLIGTCMIIGDGALTPTISVLSAMQGIQSRSTKVTQDHVVLCTVAILLLLFLFQRFGTSKVSKSFSPIMVAWFLSIALIGLYNIIKFYPAIFKALSPHYIYYFFKINKKHGWEMLGAIALCITGAEAMFADLGHFNKRSIQIAFSAMVYPALILGYSGEAAYLIKHPENMSTAFFSCIPEPIFWPMFVISTLAAVVASQSLISASFSIIRQSIALGCFPRVTMKHTSTEFEGQVYSPEVNYFLMVICILITVGFKGGVEIGNAFGVAVIWVMIITTCLMAVVMLVIWNTNIFYVLSFSAFFLCFEGMYMTSLLNKIRKGGWVPFAISGFFLIITLSWMYGRSKKRKYEEEWKMNLAEFDTKVMSTGRVPGICFFCTDLVNGIPPIVRHYMEHIGSLREIMVLVTVRILPVRSVFPEERFRVAKLGPRGVYRCLVQYGYMDKHSMEGEEYIDSVVSALKEIAGDAEEVEMLTSAVGDRAIFVLGRVILTMQEKSGNWIQRYTINNIYRFLQKNFRSNLATLRIPPERNLQIGMLYEI